MTRSDLPSPPPDGSARAALRRRLRERRSALSASERIAAAQALVASLEQLPQFLTGRRVAGYWAVDGELPLMALTPGLRARGQAWYLPVIAADRQLRFAPWQPGAALATNRHGIPEPVCATTGLLAPDQLDVVLLPLLGFDREGHRLGFGGGYYDRSFAFLGGRSGIGRPALVGVGYALQEVPALAPQPWDVGLDYVATERELIGFGMPAA